ncbi:hypothetical protein TeGR_g11408, partial [Tetraparma gracilis]
INLLGRAPPPPPAAAPGLLSRCLASLCSFLSLPRFGPAFLPRHAPDLLAAALTLDAGRHPGNEASPHSSKFLYGTPDDPPILPLPVVAAAAPRLLSLLPPAAPSAAPSGALLRSYVARANSLLSHVAAVSLPAVLDVFAPDGSGASARSSAAAARVGAQLAAPPPDCATDAALAEYFERLGAELLSCLAAADPNAAREDPAAQAAAAACLRLPAGAAAGAFFRPLLELPSTSGAAALLLCGPAPRELAERLCTRGFLARLVRDLSDPEGDPWSEVALSLLASSDPPLLPLLLVSAVSASGPPAEAEARAAALAVALDATPGFPPAPLFVLCLRVYAARACGSPQVRGCDPPLAEAAMALLPALAERCALERVLADAGTVLAVLGEILRAFAAGGGGGDPPPLPGGGGGDFTDLGFPAESTDGGAPDPERAAPLASLSAALLVGVLELGAEHRPAEEERLLDGLREPLEAIARGGESAELAEMAGHALALLGELVERAEEDLRSELPPLRARGIAQITRLVRAVVASRDEDASAPSPKIVVVGEPSPPALRPNRDLSERLVGVILKGLSDAESYVYLAAVFAMAAVADANVEFGMRTMAEAVGRGVVSFGDGGTAQLEQSARAKMAESLVHSLRRRGGGEAGGGSSSMPEALALKVVGLVSCGVVATARGSAADAEAHHAGTAAEQEQMRKLRLNTGGPVYEAEEGDVNKASALNCLYEIAMNVNSGLLERILFKLVGICAEVFRAEKLSRVVRRGAGLLARALYERALDDVNEHGPVGSSLCIELVSPKVGEDLLVKLLENAAGGRGEKDEAVRARCSEALQLREECDKLGVWAWARERGRLLEQEQKGAVGAVQRMLGGSGGGEKGGIQLDISEIMHSAR